MPVAPPLLTPAEVAARLACDEPTVRRLVRDHALPAVPLPGGDYRVRPEALDAFVAGAEAAGRSPWLTAREAAAFLGISVRTLYNNRRHIPALPGFRTLMFDPAVLREVRGSWKFRARRAGG